MTCIHLQAELNRDAINTYTLRLRPRTPRNEKKHLLLQYSVSLRYFAGSACWGASNTSRAKRWPALARFVVFTKFTQSNSISNRSYTNSFYFLITHRLNYRRNDYFSSKYCSQRFKVYLRQDVIHFFALNKAIHGMFFGSLVTIMTNLPRATYEASRSRRLFVSNLLHSYEYNFTVTVTLYFHENFMVDDKLQDRKWLSAYAFTIRVDQVNFFAWELWGLGL